MPKKLTTDEFKARVKALTHGEYCVLGDYVNAHTKIKLLHVTCGHCFMMKPNNFISGQRCPQCQRKQASAKLTMTTAMFKQRVKTLTHGEYRVLGDYVNVRTKIKLLHVTCGHVFMMRPDSFLQGRRCPQCSRKRANVKKTMTTAMFKQRVKSLTGDGYTVLGNYVNSSTKIEMRHNKCGHCFMMRPANFLHGQRCPQCQRKQASAKRTMTTATFKQRVKALTNGEYQVIGNYVNSSTKIELLHVTCGHSFMMQPHNFINGNRCPKCAIAKETMTTSEFKQRVKALVGDSYQVLGNYVNSYTKIKMLHVTCKHVFMMKPANFLQGQRCPYCNQSHGELFVEHYLKQHHIQYVAQKKFTDLYDKQPLSYDFCVNHRVLIEYQGKQHYHCIKHFGGKKRLAKQQYHDRLKAQYAKQHSYVLLAIPYTINTQKKVDCYLDKHLHI